MASAGLETRRAVYRQLIQSVLRAPYFPAACMPVVELWLVKCLVRLPNYSIKGNSQNFVLSVPLSQALGVTMKASRSDIFYFSVLGAGLVVWLFPALVFFPASALWRAATGKIDMFEISALSTWATALLVAALASTGRSFYLLRKEPKMTRAHMAFYLLTLLLVSAAINAMWRPFEAIHFFPW